MQDQIATFLQLLWRGGCYGNYWRSSDKQTQWTKCFPMDECALGNTNIYISVHPTRQMRGKWERTRIDDIQCINCLFCEWDSKDYGNLETIREHIKAFQFQPQVIVQSGGGYHGYWFFSDAIEFTESTKEYLVGTQAAWVRLSGGDKGAKDMARVLRLPGTFNAKYDPPRRVSFVRFNYTGLESELYDYNDLMHLSDGYWEEPEAIRQTQIITTDQPQTVKNWVKAFNTCTVGERNFYLFWVANRLFDLGLKESSVIGELEGSARDKGLPDKEIRRTIHSAALETRSTPENKSTSRRVTNSRPMSLQEAREDMEGKRNNHS